MAEDFVIVIVDGSPTPIEVESSTHSGRPRVGEVVAISGALHEVYRVEHEELPQSAVVRRRYFGAKVFIRSASLLSPRPTSDTSGSDETRVLPFESRRAGLEPGVTSAILPPALVAVLVACGYRAQATYFKSLKRETAKLTREGEAWRVRTPLTPSALWQLSRRAKRHCVEAQALCQALAAGGVPEPINDSASSSLIEAIRNLSPAVAPRNASSRPALRLVRAE